MQLQIEGGQKVKKSTAYLDEAGLKDGTNLILEIVDKVSSSSSKSKPGKDERKIPIMYTVRNKDQQGEP